jgi:hypothetical protein
LLALRPTNKLQFNTFLCILHLTPLSAPHLLQGNQREGHTLL